MVNITKIAAEIAAAKAKAEMLDELGTTTVETEMEGDATVKVYKVNGIEVKRESLTEEEEETDE